MSHSQRAGLEDKSDSRTPDLSGCALALSSSPAAKPVPVVVETLILMPASLWPLHPYQCVRDQCFAPGSSTSAFLPSAHPPSWQGLGLNLWPQACESQPWLIPSFLGSQWPRLAICSHHGGFCCLLQFAYAQPTPRLPVVSPSRSQHPPVSRCGHHPLPHPVLSWAVSSLHFWHFPRSSRLVPSSPSLHPSGSRRGMRSPQPWRLRMPSSPSPGSFSFSASDMFNCHPTPYCTVHASPTQAQSPHLAWTQC